MSVEQVRAVSETEFKKYKIDPLLMEAEQLRRDRKPDEALTIVAHFMNDHFDDIPALTLAAHILIDCGRIGIAQPILQHAAKIDPGSEVVWNNLGLCYWETHQLEEAERCYIKSLSRNPAFADALNNLSQLYNWMGQPHKAINCADKAIKANPKIHELAYNRGVALLTQGNYREGWKGYEFNLGKHAGRKERVYGTIPRWTGVNGLTVIAYGEQGIGDEISFASCIPDLQRGGAEGQNKVVIECDSRLVGLFKRSFNCTVHGTRYKKQVDWPIKDGADASVAFGSLPGFYRNEVSEFPGTPYLVADPQRRIMWKSLLESLGPKLKVGLAWTGGLKKTGDFLRSLTLKDMEPIWRQDATFISLQYKDAPEVEEVERDTGIKIHHFPHATQTQDMDDQVALMAELDLVITVQQTAVHIGGGLGIPTWVLIPKNPLWRYGLTGTTMPWYKSCRLYRQKSHWMHTIAEVAVDLRKLIASK
jgi:hypothetical protein